jgi:protein-S-isoprenylcysteine O-methyltransferase Ste14
MIIIDELTDVLKSMGKMAKTAWNAPPPSDPPRLRVGLGGDIPFAPPLFMAVSVLGGFLVSAVTGLPGAVLESIVPANYYIPARAVGTLAVAHGGAQLKRNCNEALAKAGTEAAFQSVQTVADTGPYSKCRNPMYVAIMALPGMIGLAFDNAWVLFGSNALLWLYLHFVVVPAEETFLHKQLGEPYKKYTASVKRWGLF